MTRSELGRIAGGTVVVLAIPAVAMGLTDEVDWGPGDFLVAGSLLTVSGLTYWALARRTRSGTRRLLVGVGVGLVLVIVWATLAVGLE